MLILGFRAAEPARTPFGACHLCVTWVRKGAKWTPLAVRGAQLATLRTCRVENAIHRNVSKRVVNSSKSVSENLVL